MLQVAPVFPDVEGEVGDSVPPIIEVDAAESKPAGGRVVPFEFPAEAEVGEATSLEAVPDVSPADTGPEEATGEAAPVESPQAPPGIGRAKWGKTALLRLGMPAPIIESPRTFNMNTGSCPTSSVGSG